MHKFKFHTKLFTILAGVVCIAMVATLLTAQKATRTQVEKKIKTNFENTRVILRRLQSLKAGFNAREIETIAVSNSQFRSVLSTASIEENPLGFGYGGSEIGNLKDLNLRLASILPFLKIYAEADIFVTTDSDGTLLFSKASPGKYGININKLSLFQEASQVSLAEDIWYLDNDGLKAYLLPDDDFTSPYQIISKAVVFNNNLHGMVMVGHKIKQQTLEEIKQISKVDLVLTSPGGILLSTLPEGVQKDLEKAIRENPGRFTGTDPKKTRLADQTFIHMQIPVLKDLPIKKGSFIILKSLTAEMAFISKLQKNIAALGAAILTVVLILAFVMSNSITKPIKKLTKAAGNVGEGNLDAKVNIATGDELEVLGNAFNEMLDGIKEKESIRRYSLVLQDELERGKKIQKDFLPHQLPAADHCEIAFHFQSALKLSGDFYDVFKLGHNEIGFAVGDVSDKGVGSALFMASIRSLLRIFSGAFNPEGDQDKPDQNLTPQKALQAVSSLNRYIAREHGEEGIFATLFLGVLQPSTKTLFYVNAGHEPVCIVDHTGFKKELKPTGPAVGPILDANYQVEATELYQNDLILAFTDGVTEARSETNGFFGRDRLYKILRKGHSDSARQLISAIQKDVNCFRGKAVQNDDMTMLCLKIL